MTAAHRTGISIHALREEGDVSFLCNQKLQFNFYPRPPRGGRPDTQEPGQDPESISIHALREEGDSTGSSAGPSSRNFYPRPPRGGRLFKIVHRVTSFTFLSTPSARRATCLRYGFFNLRDISIHALREEGDLPASRCCPVHTISIHALREEGDSKNRDKISIFL